MSENEGVTASVTIDFEAVCVGAENYLSAELDSDLNEGRSCFHYGEPAYFRVYRYPEDMVITLESSDGAITKVGKDYSKEYAENISFINTDQGQVSKLILLIQDYGWYGRSLGVLLKVGALQIRAENAGIAIAYINYTTEYDVYSITVNPPGNYKEWPVVVVISEVL